MSLSWRKRTTKYVLRILCILGVLFVYKQARFLEKYQLHENATYHNNLRKMLKRKTVLTFFLVYQENLKRLSSLRSKRILYKSIHTVTFSYTHTIFLRLQTLEMVKKMQLLI
jgi:hypothetical protein